MASDVVLLPESLWEKHAMAVEDVNQRMRRITDALDAAGVPYALVGGQAVAVWVATRDPKAVRTTKDVDILLSRLVDRVLLAGLPPELAARLDSLLVELGR